MKLDPSDQVQLHYAYAPGDAVRPDWGAILALAEVPNGNGEGSMLGVSLSTGPLMINCGMPIADALGLTKTLVALVIARIPDEVVGTVVYDLRDLITDAVQQRVANG